MDAHISLTAEIGDVFTSALAWSEYDGTESFTAHTVSTLSVPHSVFAADLESDGDLDIVAGNCVGFDGYLDWFENRRPQASVSQGDPVGPPGPIRPKRQFGAMTGRRGV
jgi:hypothetical protein